MSSETSMSTGADEREPVPALSAPIQAGIEAEGAIPVAHDLAASPHSTLAAFGRAQGGRETPGYLLDVRLTLSVEVGRVQMPMREVMELGPGSIVELQRAAGEPVEIFANGRCIGYGEIVVVGDQFGVRISELGGSS